MTTEPVTPSPEADEDLVATARRIGCTLAIQLADEIERLRSAAPSSSGEAQRVGPERGVLRLLTEVDRMVRLGALNARSSVADAALDLADQVGYEMGTAEVDRVLPECPTCHVAWPPPATSGEAPTVDALAQEIRRVDGSHTLGAGALAEALMPFLTATPAASGEAQDPPEADPFAAVKALPEWGRYEAAFLVAQRSLSKVAYHREDDAAADLGRAVAAALVAATSGSGEEEG